MRLTMGLSIALVLSMATTAVAIDSESQFRHTSTGTLPEQEFGLSVRWNRELGSGYSNVTLAGGRAITMFTTGTHDVVAAFDPETGEELWRYELGEMYAGHDGSDDGPLSTPAVADGRVHVLAPRGRLVALSFEDGSEIWSRALDETNSTPPFYGYSSSPILVGDLVVLATGGDGHALTAFDRATGETRWAAGNDAVTYQTPWLVDLGGRPTLVLASNHLLQGFDPKTGEVYFTHRHTEGEQTEETAHVIPVDGDSFVVNYQSGSKRYRWTDDRLEEVWESRAFANTLAIPVLFQGHLYGFTGRFMTCADAETGEIVWRSRPPLGRGIALVDNKLAVLAASGDLVLIDPSPEGYREVTRTPVFDEDDYATASFAGDTFYLRNLERMAAVGIDTSKAPQLAEIEASGYLLGELAEWANGVSEMSVDQRQAAVDARFAEIEASPFFEGDSVAHFFWRGEAEDVGLEANEIVEDAENGLYRLPGTDLFLRSAELDPRAQYTYALTIDYEQAVPDPRNPYTVDNGFNVVSEVRMPQWPTSPHLETPAEDAARGELDTFPFHSEILGNTRQIQVWRPPGYSAAAETRYPLLIVNHGDNLLRGGLMRNTLDNLVGNSVAPLVAVFVPRTAPPEYGGPQIDDYLRFLIGELIPHLDHHYATDGRRRAIMGPGSAGLTAVYAALQHPELFQQAAAQSLYPIEPAYDRLPEMIEVTEPGPEAVILVWSRNDYDLGDGRTAEGATGELLEWLREADIPVTEQVSDYSPGWGGWRGQHDEILAALFPLEAPSGP